MKCTGYDLTFPDPPAKRARVHPIVLGASGDTPFILQTVGATKAPGPNRISMKLTKDPKLSEVVVGQAIEAVNGHFNPFIQKKYRVSRMVLLDKGKNDGKFRPIQLVNGQRKIMEKSHLCGLNALEG